MCCQTLKYGLTYDCRRDLLELLISSKAVICCRMSPLQKAELVSLIRRHDRDAVTLGIGDGANDVGMIQVVCDSVSVTVSGSCEFMYCRIRKHLCYAECVNSYVLRNFINL